MTIKPYIENNSRKLFEFIGNPDNDLRANLDRQNPGLKAIFIEATICIDILHNSRPLKALP